MRRGEIWTVAGGVYASKPRPAVIVQDDHFAATDSVTIAPITTVSVDAPLLRIPVRADSGSGLREDSFVMVDKLTSVRRSQVHQHVGQLTAEQLVEFERSLIVFLGLAG